LPYQADPNRARRWHSGGAATTRKGVGVPMARTVNISPAEMERIWAEVAAERGEAMAAPDRLSQPYRRIWGHRGRPRYW
jgi:hypothetical protein